MALYCPTEQLFLLQALAEDTAAESFERVLRAVKTTEVQITKIQDLEKKLENVKVEHESLESRLDEDKVFQ